MVLAPGVLQGEPVAWAPSPYEYRAFGSAYSYKLAFTAISIGH